MVEHSYVKVGDPSCSDFCRQSFILGIPAT